MIKVLFIIPNLMHGGAERVLVNLVNHMDQDRFDITVQTMFDVGIYKDKFVPGIKYIGGFPWYFRGNTIVYKAFSPKFLFSHYVKNDYDIIVSYLEGPSARVVGGCPKNKQTKLVCWIHTELKDSDSSEIVFRNEAEAFRCYKRFDRIVCVSNHVRNSFHALFPALPNPSVLYNTVESDVIFSKSLETVEEPIFFDDRFEIISVGKLLPVKGYDRLIQAIKRLSDDGVPVHLSLIGSGALQKDLESLSKSLGIEDKISLLGYKENPYKYVRQADVFVCSSNREGLSTAVTEALIVGTAVVSTDCSGARELLGENNEYGLVVENTETGIYEGIKEMLANDRYKEYSRKAAQRGKQFNTEYTAKAVEDMFEELVKK